MNALAPAPVRPRRRPFVVPRDDVRWCAALAEALSVCCSGPSDWRLGEVRALLAHPPEQMLPAIWTLLAKNAADWVAACGDCPAQTRPKFGGRCVIEMALKNKPVPPQPWEERYP